MEDTMSQENVGGQPPSEHKMEQMREAQARFLSQLLKIPGVHGVGIGYKKVAGETTDQLAIVVRVDHKLPFADVDPRHLIPPQFSFHSRNYAEEVVVVTDVQERPRAVEYSCIADHALEARVRPIAGGYSIGLVAAGGGTLGGWVWDNENEQIVLLTNKHVLGSTAGADVLQPSDGDGGVFPADHFADVVRTGTLDATIAVPIDTDDIELEIEGIGPAVYEIAEATLGMRVEKSGQTTEHTTGRVVLVNYVSHHYGSTHDIEVDADPGTGRFAYYGDSGSLIVERTNPDGNNWKRVVGLLWGGDPSETNAYAHHIGDVFEDLDLNTVCAGVGEAVGDDLFEASYARAGEPLPLAQAPKDWMRPEPLRPFPGRRFFHGMSRDIEARLTHSERGQEAIELVHAHRVEILDLVRSGDFQRALVGSMAPFVHGAWTTDEIFERVVTHEDVERFQRLLKVTEAKHPEMGKVLEYANKLIKEAHGHRLGEIFG
jgi:hypothetical protein